MSGFSLDSGEMAELAKRLDDISAAALNEPIPDAAVAGVFGNDLLDAAYGRFLGSVVERTQLAAQWSENIASFVRHSVRASTGNEEDLEASFKKTVARLSGEQ
ncbi:hypothetical protein [Schaalia vaccimaxillae]|uniref:hypothetical protein n=1 Tax=Schaalia vaccimaxillae TaxID=183916 RepID=UPI0003B79E37|nr:hypothetical protein [Schaalia vaccimaxillae]